MQTIIFFKKETYYLLVQVQVLVKAIGINQKMEKYIMLVF